MGLLIIMSIIFFSGMYALLRSPEKAFLNVYLTILLYIPQNLEEKIPGLPSLKTAQASIIPIFLVFVFFQILDFFIGSSKNRWKFTLTDLLIPTYIFICVYSEYMNEGSSLGTNYLASMLSTVFAPYILGKALIVPKKLSIIFSKRYVFAIFIIILLSLYEMRMTLNPFLVIPKWFFPAGQGEDLPTLYRFGFVRIGGPFLQPIIFAMAISIAMFFNYWLYKNRFWERAFKYLPLPISKKMAISIVLLFGLIMTFSRGPMLSTILGAMIIGIGFSKHKLLSLIVRGSAIGALTMYAILAFLEIAGIGRGLAESGEAATIAYRGELLQEYLSIAMQKPIWGWGNESWPKVSDLFSIDNHYLWVALKHGFIAIGIFVFIQLYAFIRVIIRGLRDKRTDVADCSLAFTFAGVLISYAVCLTTVFMGLQLEPLFFILIGWIESYLLLKPEDFILQKVPNKQSKVLRVTHGSP